MQPSILRSRCVEYHRMHREEIEFVQISVWSCVWSVWLIGCRMNDVMAVFCCLLHQISVWSLGAILQTKQKKTLHSDGWDALWRIHQFLSPLLDIFPICFIESFVCFHKQCSFLISVGIMIVSKELACINQCAVLRPSMLERNFPFRVDSKF